MTHDTSTLNREWPLTLADDQRVLPPEERHLGMVFQSYALWPHMSVAQNVGFSLRRAGYSKTEIENTVDDTLRLVQMSEYKDRPSSALSGGQQQRIAIARALASKPAVMLFDEPLSNLDAVLRESMRIEIRDIQRQTGMTGIYVTHSQEEALALADKVAVMNDGIIQQLDPPQELYTRPVNRFVAGFVGLSNVFSGTLTQAGRVPRVRILDQELGVAETDRLDDHSVGDDVSIAARPENIHISSKEDKGAGSSYYDLSVQGSVTRTVFSGNLIDYFVRIPSIHDEVRIQSFPPSTAEPGDEVSIKIHPEHLIALKEQL